ncbi:hypothetical protein R6Q59_001554 [Mikania micrantha]
MNKENYGYRRLYGRGVKNTLIKKVEGPTSYMIPEGLIESFKANANVEKNQLLEMCKEIEDDHERKKAEFEAIREDIDSQCQNLEAMRQKVLEAPKLPRNGPLVDASDGGDDVKLQASPPSLNGVHDGFKCQQWRFSDRYDEETRGDARV